MKRLGSPQGQPAVERARDATARPLLKAESFGELVGIGEQGAADHVAVPVQEFRRRVHDHICAQVERPLQKRSGERVVHGQKRPGFVCNLGASGDVGDRDGRIAGSLDMDEPCLRSDRGANLVQVRRVDEIEQDAKSGPYVPQHPVYTPVHIGAADQVIARTEEALEDRLGGGEPRREGGTVTPVLECRQIPLQRLTSRVLDSRVVIPVSRGAHGVLHVGRSLEDGGHDGAGGRVRPLTRVYCSGPKPSFRVIQFRSCSELGWRVPSSVTYGEIVPKVFPDSGRGDRGLALTHS